MPHQSLLFFLVVSYFDRLDAAHFPPDPSCICIVFADRLLAHQSLAELQRDCALVGPGSGDDAEMPWVNETACNCPGTADPLPAPGGPRSPLTHVGRAKVFLPYVGVALRPRAAWPGEQPGGHNYHFPRGGGCPEGAALGEGGCTWRRLPASRMVYGPDLEAAGWDRTFVPDVPGNTTHTEANVAAFRAALKSLDSRVRPTACGGAD